MSGQMQKGVLEMCILNMISSNEKYGYEIMKTISSFFPSVAESVVYTILRRINSLGYADVVMKKSCDDRVRKYYYITAKGMQYLNLSLNNWEQTVNAVSQIIDRH